MRIAQQVFVVEHVEVEDGTFGHMVGLRGQRAERSGGVHQAFSSNDILILCVSYWNIKFHNAGKASRMEPLTEIGSGLGVRNS